MVVRQPHNLGPATGLPLSMAAGGSMISVLAGEVVVYRGLQLELTPTCSTASKLVQDSQ